MRTTDALIAAANEAADFDGPPVQIGGDRTVALSETTGDGVLLTAADVEKATTLDLKTIDRLVAKDRFPAPVPLSDRRRAWRRADVLRWAADPYGWVSF